MAGRRPERDAVGGTNLVTKYAKGSNDSTYVSENANPDPIAGKNAGVWARAAASASCSASRPGRDWYRRRPACSAPCRTWHAHGRLPKGCGDAVWRQPQRDYEEIGGKQLVQIGTSAASPDFAGLLALKVKLTGGRLGNANPTSMRKPKPRSLRAPTARRTGTRTSPQQRRLHGQGAVRPSHRQRHRGRAAIPWCHQVAGRRRARQRQQP